MTDLESLFLLHVRAYGFPEPETQFKFHPVRKWRADFAWTTQRIIVEINGMTWVAKRGHTSGTGIHRDYEKGNAAQMLGWLYLSFDGQMIRSGSAIETLKTAFEMRGERI